MQVPRGTGFIGDIQTEKYEKFVLDNFHEISIMFHEIDLEDSVMSNLQIKGIDEDLYAQIKEMARAENRSLSQQILYLAKEYMTKQKQIRSVKTPAQVLLELSGSWYDDRGSEEIIQEIKKGRRNSRKLEEGW